MNLGRVSYNGSMSTPILATKLYIPPPRSKIVLRPRLIERTNEGLHSGRKLTIISAPAGFGKTTLVSEWIASRKRPVAWLSLDEGDNDITRFLTYLIAALQTLVANIGEGLLGVLQSPQPPTTESILTTLINEITTIPDNFILVLDDYHIIDSKPVDTALAFLLEHLPPQMHLVITTREDPQFPLARLRARGQLIELRAADLRFTPSEAAEFLNQMIGLNLSAEDVAALEVRTEGWVAGLQLAALSMQGHENPSEFVATLSSNNRFILGYLIEEVLKCQPPEIQNFLLQTSILSKLNGDLCDAVTGQADSATRLEQLLVTNLFLIPLDDEGRWYRYHHLFADLLTNQLRRAHPDLPIELHRRASRWYETQAMPADTIEHTISAGDYARAISLLEEHAWGLLNQGCTRLIETWMQSIPADWHTRSVRINLSFAWIHLLRGNFEQVVPYLYQVEAILATLDPVAQETAAIQAECLALQSNLLQAQGKIAESIESATRALQLAVK